jgi:tRNA (guanine26-N2/guanine27-N2)-dimethyltransferase
MAQLAQEWGWRSQADLLGVMAAEAHLPPYYYLLGEIGRRGRMDIPNRDRLVAALQSAGYQAARAHAESQAVKTTASFSHCLNIARGLGPG